MEQAKTYPPGVPCSIDNEWTRAAVVADRQGAIFTLSQFDPH